jgi:glycosyltransferase involved in cell wall biosynthesis
MSVSVNNPSNNQDSKACLLNETPTLPISSQPAIRDNIETKMPLSSAIRILHVIPTLGRGGAERQLVSLVTNATAGEHIVCYLREPSDFAEELRSKGHVVVCLNAAGGAKWLTGAARLRKLIKLYQPDIVQTWLLDASISVRLSQILGPRVPLVTALQNPDYEPETIRTANWPRMKTSNLRRLDQLTARWTTPRFVACSNFVKRSAQEHLGIPESSLEVIYNSVDPATLRCQSGEPQQLRESLAIPPDGIIFLNVGRLDPQKGQEYLLRAFQKVASAAPKAFLVILGEGSFREHLTALTKELAITDSVRFAGRRPNVGAFLEMADVFVFPSLFEGLGLALVEAMFKALPCIVSRIDVLQEVIEDQKSGLVVAPDSVEELAGAMIQLYRDPARRDAFGAKAEQIAEARFHQQVTIPQWENLYARLLEK